MRCVFHRFLRAGTHVSWATSQKSGRRARRRGGGASALARRSAHSEYLGTSIRVDLMPGREGVVPLCLEAE